MATCLPRPPPAKMRATMPKCSFPDCGHDAFAAELCVGHYQQKHREPKRALRPLRPINQVRLGSVRVSEECAAALEAKGPNKAAAAKAVLEEWAKTWRGR